MIYLHDTTDFKFENTVVTIGKFDGLHMGHQLLLDELKKYRNLGLKSVVLSFDFTPMEVLTGRKVRPIYTEEEKINLLKANGPDIYIEYPFTQKTADTEAVDFLQKVLIGQLGARVIVAGDDFAFGKGRKGDTAFLKNHADEFGYRVVICPKMTISDEVVSSTAIRNKLESGDSAGAEIMLNKSYFFIDKDSSVEYNTQGCEP